MFETLKELIEDEAKIADYSYWEERSLPSGLSAIIIDLLITEQSVPPEKLKVYHQKLVQDASHPPGYLINMFSYLLWRAENPNSSYYRSNRIGDPATQNNTITINNQIYEFYPHMSTTCCPVVYSNGLYRYELKVDDFT